MIKLANIPAILVGTRFAIAPFLLLDAADGSTGRGFILGYTLAVLSDIFDGILARKLKVSTPQLRQADSWADICLCLCVALGSWFAHPAEILAFRTPLLLAIALQLTLFAISLIKFGKFPSFHTYTAKAWGLALCVATIGLFGFGYSPTLWLAIGFCLVNSLEEIAMTLLLPEWHCDVLSIFHTVDLARARN